MLEAAGARGTQRGYTRLHSRPEAAGASRLAVDQDAGLPLVLAVAAADAHEAAGALPAAEAPPRHLGALALQRCLHLHRINYFSRQP